MPSKQHPEEYWKQLLSTGKLTFTGYLNGSQFVLQEEEKYTLFETFLAHKPTGDRKAVKVKVTIEVTSKDMH